MLANRNPYNEETPKIEDLLKVSKSEITKPLQRYLQKYHSCFVRSQQVKYFEAFAKGLLSNLDRKSIEPIALSFLEEKDVRGMQQFFTRSKGWDEAADKCYKNQLSGELSDTQGFLSVDECDFVKKGKASAGVARQYCGRLGKRENCQAGVFLSYASEKGIGLIDSRLYLPKDWFGDDYEEKRKECRIPQSVKFETKNAIAKKAISDVLESRQFEIGCVGCDASFGSDHTFLDGLPEKIHYFASVRENEYIFKERPKIVMPENLSQKGGRFKYPRAQEQPIAVKAITNDESIPWVKRSVAEGAKGSVIAEVKCLRCASCRKENRLFMPKAEIWIYIRKHEDGKIKYFVSNLPSDTNMEELDKFATARWSIEQCFQECKSFLGMTHYETRSYQAWHRHMLLVMIVQLFVTILRNCLKKTNPSHNANDSLYCRLTNTNSNPFKVGSDDRSLSFAS